MRGRHGSRYSVAMRPCTASFAILRASLRGAAALALVLAAGCGGSPGHAPASSEGSTPAALQPVTAGELLARVREPGARATLVNVWATWCGPCREEFPTLVSLAERRRADGLRVLFVSADFDDQAEEAREFLAVHRAPEPWLWKSGPDMEFIDGLEHRWSGALPATIVYDSAGMPVEFWEGGADSARFEAAVAPLLATRH